MKINIISKAVNLSEFNFKSNEIYLQYNFKKIIFYLKFNFFTRKSMLTIYTHTGAPQLVFIRHVVNNLADCIFFSAVYNI